MLFRIDNIGKLRNAEIALRGITVIAGRNNTGKSTIGKVLYCMLRHFHNVEENIQIVRQDELSRIIAPLFFHLRNGIAVSHQFAKNILSNNDNVDDCLKKIQEIRIKPQNGNIIDLHV